MVKYEDYLGALVNNPDKYPVIGFESGNIKNTYRDNDESIIIKFEGDKVGHPRKAGIYTYDYVEGKQTRFVIAYEKYRVSINKQEDGYGGIKIRNTIFDSPDGENILDLGFCDDHFYFAKLKEKSREDIKACDWTVEKVLDEMLHAVLITWDDEKWKKESEMIFNFLKPALTLAIMDTRTRWEEYNRQMEEYWEKCIAEIDEKIKKLNDERNEVVNGSYSSYKRTRETLEAQSNGSKKK